MKAALYIRVSTDEQAQEGYSIKAQEQRLKDYLKSQGWILFDSYIEDGYSAKNLERPTMKRLIEDIKKQEFDVVLVYKLDRLVRSVADLHELLQLFDENNVKFKSATEMFDTTSAMGRFFITLVASMAQWERENLAERVIMGMNRMVEEGNRPGAVAPFGYDHEDGKLVINEKESKYVRMIFDEYKTKGKRAVAEQLNNLGIFTKKGYLWNDSVISYIVNNPIYCGFIRWNYRKTRGGLTNEEIIIKGKHEPIISKEQFDETQSIMGKRKGKGYKGTTNYPFTGIAKCARCGKPLIGARRPIKGGFHRYYKCTGRFNYKICDLPIISEELIEEQLLENLNLHSLESPSIESEIDIDKLNAEITKIQKRMERIKELYFDGDISKSEYKERTEKEKDKELEIIEILESADQIINIADVEEVLLALKENWSIMTYEGRKKMTHAVIDYIKVEVTKETVGGPGKKPEIAITEYKMN